MKQQRDPAQPSGPAQPDIFWWSLLKPGPGRGVHSDSDSDKDTDPDKDSHPN